MFKVFRRIRKRDEGFTLVELMVVVLIIGILVAIAIPVFNAARARAQERACHANQRTIEGAVQQWLADSTANQLANATVAALVPRFITEPPRCPAAGPGTGTTYTVRQTDSAPGANDAGQVVPCTLGPAGDPHGRFQAE